MLIACEKCSTTYVLDDGLIPPQGAPVQCTKCSHVFIAKPAPAPTVPIRPGDQTVVDSPPKSGANQTMMFGASSPSGVRGATSTQMFGAPAAAKPPQSAPATTMMFGAAGAAPPIAPAGPPPNSTMMFGAVTASLPAPAPSNQTMMFGAVGSGPAVPTAAPANQTMMFGGPAAAPPAAPANSTMMFGAVAPVAVPAAPTRLPSTTVMFGTPAAPPAAAGPTGPANTTMMFGAVSKPMPKVTAGPVLERSESTVRVDIDRMMAERGQGSPPDAPQHDRTQLALDPQSAPNQGNRTVMFAMSSMSEPTAPDGQATVDPSVVVEPSSAPTLPGERPVNRTMMFAGSSTPATDRPAASPSLELPPEPAFTNEPQPLPSGLDADADIAALQQSSKRRTTIALVVVGVLLLAFVLFVGWSIIGPRLMGGSVPAEMRGTVEAALVKLRLDDGPSKKEAVGSLRGVVGQMPTFVDAHAGLVLALSLEYDDLQQRAARVKKKYEQLMKRLETAKADGDKTGAVVALTGRINELSKAYQSLLPEVSASREQLQNAANGLNAVAATASKGSAAELAVLRANAVLRGVIGEGEALTLAERAKAIEADDVWLEVAVAEYAANVTSPSRAEAIQNVSALAEKSAGGTLVRGYVLAARLELLEGEPAEAIAHLEKALALRPEHQVAKELLEWSKREQAEAKN